MARKLSHTPNEEIEFHGKHILPDSAPERAGMKIMGVALGLTVVALLAVAAVFVWLSPWS